MGYTDARQEATPRSLLEVTKSQVKVILIVFFKHSARYMFQWTNRQKWPTDEGCTSVECDQRGKKKKKNQKCFLRHWYFVHSHPVWSPPLSISALSPTMQESVQVNRTTKPLSWHSGSSVECREASPNNECWQKIPESALGAERSKEGRLVWWK